MEHPDPWLRRYRPRPRANSRLVLFPHAGGSASAFRTWAQEVPEDVEVLAAQYPGRGDRLGEELVDDMEVVANSLLRACMSGHPPRVALFGHSLGAAVAFEVASRWEQASGSGVQHLFVSGRASPDRPGRRHQASDDDLWEDVVGLGGTAPELLANDEIRQLSLPVLRNDYRLSETYRPVPGRGVSCPITAYHGRSDPEVPSAAAVEWTRWTSGRCTSTSFEGGHFFLDPHRTALIRDVTTRIGVAPPGQPGSLP